MHLLTQFILLVSSIFPEMKKRPLGFVQAQSKETLRV